MKKEQINVTKNDEVKEEKGMKKRLIRLKEKLIPALSGAFAGAMLMSTTCFAADTSAVTQPLDNLKTLIIAVIGAVGIIILAKNVMEFAQAYQQQDSSTMNSALKGIVAGVMMAGMMESIQNRIVENGQKGKATWLYIDEFHVLLNSEYSAKYLQQLWKKVRKQGGLCTGITQNVVDLLQNYTATTMLANSEFVALLKQANTDSSKMAEVIGVSEAQLRFVTNTASGMGLLKCGSVVIPFDNQISKDTDLYRLYNTNIHEIIENSRLSHVYLL